MTPDLLAALRETPGCGQDPDCTWPHDRAVEQANECDPCLTRLAEAVIKQVVARFPINDFDRTVTEIVWSSGLEKDGLKTQYRAALLASLLTALRSETPR